MVVLRGKKFQKQNFCDLISPEFFNPNFVREKNYKLLLSEADKSQNDHAMVEQRKVTSLSFIFQPG